MKRYSNSLVIFIGSFLVSFVAVAQYPDFKKFPVYYGQDLGLTYTSENSFFRIYSPTADSAELLLFSQGVDGLPQEKIFMEQSENGTWTATLNGDRKGTFYTFRVKINNTWSKDVPDPYVKCVGVNGKRGMIADLSETNPRGWEHDKSPEFKKMVDAIIYELHVRDASIHPSSGIKNKGKFLGLAEENTKSPSGKSTGLEHIKDLGVTHVHLLPSYDFNSIDESIPDNPKYNWGYDPLNYNVPEGSYSTDATDGVTRIKEFKELIHAFHKNGLRVVMDVVYNHTALTENSNFNQLVPGYYYRQNQDGTFSNGSACGNETASDRPMMRKFIIESVKYWVEEYHIDGFRFDLMGIHDIKTMNLIYEELSAIKPDILLYGEGWSAGTVQLKQENQALKHNASKLNNIAVFSDDVRDGIKGSVFNHEERGFVSGLAEQAESIKFGVVASCSHPQIDYTKVKYAKGPYAANPNNTISYCECHDNHTLWDKLTISMPNATFEERKNMHKLALSIVLTSQGISFLHAGTEFLRSKNGVENSFESPDEINAIDWTLKEKNEDVFEYVQALINMRKDHPAFRFVTNEQIVSKIRFMENCPENVVAYTLDGTDVRDRWRTILVVYNGSNASKKIDLPKGKWKYYIKDNQKSKGHLKETTTAGPYSCSILYQ